MDEIPVYWGWTLQVYMLDERSPDSPIWFRIWHDFYRVHVWNSLEDEDDRS